MTSQKLTETLIKELDIQGVVKKISDASLVNLLAFEPTQDTNTVTPKRLPRIGLLYENRGILAYQQYATNQSEDALQTLRDSFFCAFTCWRALIELPGIEDGDTRGNNISSHGLQVVGQEAGNDLLAPELNLAFRISLTGLLGNRTPETRLELKRFRLLPQTTRSWKEQVANYVFSAFALLVRKLNGWDDVNAALLSIEQLRRRQQEFEEGYLANQGDEAAQTMAAVDLVGLYHLAQIVTIVGEYLRDGRDSIAQVNTRLDRHRDRANTAFQTTNQGALMHLTNLLWAGCRELARNAIWTHINRLGERTRGFGRLLADKTRQRPVIELWPSQQEALRRNLLDPYPNAILVEMPTSAGKTLLAEFAIVQTKALNPEGTIAYIVPTRALVNQITITLRADFREVKPAIRVEQAVPAFELDPTEDRLLKNCPDVLVTTPEKLDLLIRREHPVVKELALVIADEAHHIKDEGRGARLELLLGTIKRDKAGARFLLLSPFLPNDEELVKWLGEDRALPPIAVDWRPNRRLVSVVKLAGRGSKRSLVLAALPSVDNADITPGTQISISPASNVDGDTVNGLTEATVRALVRRGSVLILCRGRGTAVTRAQELAQVLPETRPSPFMQAVQRYLQDE